MSITSKIRIMAALIILILDFSPCLAREIIDMSGRRVAVPSIIRRVAGASPPATHMVYAMDPGLVAGLNFPFNSTEKKYMDPRMEQLPVIGGWFGQGRTPNLETLLQVRPDIILVWMWRRSAVNEKIERTLEPLGFPVVYVVMESLADYPKAFRFLGELLNREERGGVLSRYAEESLAEAKRVRTGIPEEHRLSVYYAEGPDGLSTECRVSVHAELIPLSGAKNVHLCGDDSDFGMQKISMEQVIRYDPQVIVSHEPLFFDSINADSRWKNIRAVRDRRVYRIPKAPFNWFDRPPSFMRLLGIKWLIHHLYPEAYPVDLAAETRRFYQLFLNISLDDRSIRELLAP